jgi:hypothetical protein
VAAVVVLAAVAAVAVVVVVAAVAMVVVVAAVAAAAVGMGMRMGGRARRLPSRCHSP